MDDSNYVAKNSSLAMLYRDLRPDEIVDDVRSGTAVYDGVVKDMRRTVKGDDRVYVQHTDEFVEQYVQYLESEDDSYVQYYIGKSAPLFIHAIYPYSDFQSKMGEYVAELRRCFRDLNIDSNLHFSMIYTISMDADQITGNGGNGGVNDGEGAEEEDDPLDDDDNDSMTKFLLICPFIGIEYLQVVLDASPRLRESNAEMQLLSGDCPLLNKGMTLSYISRGDVIVTEWNEDLDDVAVQLNYFLNSPRITVCADDPIRISEEMIKILRNKDRNHFLEDTTLFINLGKILHNLYRRDEEKALTIWKEIAGISEDRPTCTVDGIEYDEEQLEDLLNEFAIDNHLSYKTLIWYARTLEYNRYRLWSDRWFKEGLIFHTYHYHALAQLFFKMYPDSFLCTEGGKRWYFYQDGTWIRDDGNLHFKNILNTSFTQYIQSVIIPDYINRKISQSIIDAVKKLVPLISKPIVKNGIIADAAYYYEDPKLNSKLDSNKFLLNTANCLIDFSNNSRQNRHVHIRDPMPEDFITKRIPVGYNKRLHMGHKRIKMIEDFLRKIFPDDETRYRACIIFASFLVGGNKDKKLYIMSGPKDSAKSTFKSIFLDRVLSNEPDGYARDAPIEALIKSNKNSSQANPELAQAKNCKVVTFTEPEKGVTFEASMIKRITGGDASFGRALYENGGSIKSTFKYVVQCNTIPVLKSYDLPALERFFIIPFLSKFSDNAPESEEEQWEKRIFPKDDTIQDNTGKYAEALFWYILQFIPKYFEEGIKASAEMTAKISEYVSRNDVYMEFIINEIERKADANLPCRDLFNRYKQWNKENYGGNPYFSYSDVIQEILTRLDNAEKTVVNGKEVIRGYALNDSNRNFTME